MDQTISTFYFKWSTCYVQATRSQSLEAILDNETSTTTAQWDIYSAKKKMKKKPKKTFKTFRLEKTTENQELHKNQKSNRFQS